MSALKGNNLYQYELTDILSENIRNWVEYGLLEKGGYTPVLFSSAASGYTTLQRNSDNKTFEGIGPSWVWETDVASDIFRPSGIYVNNTFYNTATTSGTYRHIIDYRNGRVVFMNAISTSATVKCEYVARDIDVFLSDSEKWNVILDDYESRFNSMGQLAPSGLSQVLKQNRVWIPSVVVQTTTNGVKGLQLGGGEISSCEVKFYTFADKPFINNKLCDILIAQFEKQIRLFNLNTRPRVYNFNGTLSSGALTYKQLTVDNSPYFWTYATIIQARGGPMPSSSDVKTGAITYNVEVDRYLSTYS